MTTNYYSPAVNVRWSGPNKPSIAWFYNEVKVTIPQDTTYFMTNGWDNKGYMGLQQYTEKGITKKLVLFAVWDTVDTDKHPEALKQELVSDVAHGKGVNVEAFTGEGTGRHARFPYNWKVGAKYQLLVGVRKAPGDTTKAIYSGFFRLPESNTWRLIASFQVTIRSTMYLDGPNSFLENWSSNNTYSSPKYGLRSAEYGPVFVKSDDPTGKWVQLTHAKGGATKAPHEVPNNRNTALSHDHKQIVMNTGGPPLDDITLSERIVLPTKPIPPVLVVNRLPEHDGAPALVKWPEPTTDPEKPDK